MLIERREFLKLIGGLSGAVVAGGAGLAAVGQVLEVPDELIERVRNGPGIESWKSTVCGQCPGGCGIKVRLIDGIPVYIKGNPLHPINQGGMCPLGHSSIEVLFNPDRLKGPVRRVGPKGGGKWEPLDWDTATGRVASVLSTLRDNGRPHQVVFLGSDERGLMRRHIARFMRAYGSPNYYQVPSPYGSETATRLSIGRSVTPSPDLTGARLIVSFGSNFLEEGHSPVYYTKLYSRLRGISDGRRPRFVQIEPRMSLTASNADQWIPILPGTYAALALGVAHILIREELYDAGFVRNQTFGFESWNDARGERHVGYKDLVLSDYYPERVSELSGVPSRTILELARNIGNTRPSVVLEGEGVTGSVNGTYAQMAVHSLNALLGNFGDEGAVIFPEPPPFSESRPVQLDDVAREGGAVEPVAPGLSGSFPITEYSFDDLSESLRSGRPYPIEVLFLYRGNPLFRLPGHNSLRQALERIPVVVSFDSFVTETNEYADMILPEHTYLERWDAISEVPSVAFTHVGIRQPVIEPIHDTRHTGDVLISFARDLDAPVSDAFPDQSYEDVIKDRLRGIYESGEGAVASPGLKEAWMEFMRQRGWQIGRYASFDSFWRELLEKGAWWNPIRTARDPSDFFRTPSGKYEFYAQGLRLEPARPDHDHLPHHESVADADGMPLRLISFQTLTNRNGFGSNQPLMQEMFGYQVRHYWTSWAEINPETAEAFHIGDGDWVWIQSVVGSVRVQAKVVPGIAPGVLAVPFGLGHTSYGRYARDHGANPHMIMKGLYDRLSGRPALSETRVSLSQIA